MKEEKRIKILIVLNTLATGGAQIQLARMAPHFDNKKFHVQVAYYDNAGCGHPAKLLKDAGIKVTYLDRPKWGRIPYLFKAAVFMRREHFDIVHAWHGSANLYATVPAIIARVPAVIGGIRGKHNTAIDWILRSIVNLWCVCWVTNSKSAKKVALQKMKFVDNRSIVVIPNGLKVNNKSIFKKDAETLYDELISDKAVIGTVGRLDPIKNHLLFVDMAKRLIKSGCNADFWIIGDGKMKKEIELAIEKNGLRNTVKMLGYRADINVALSRMDIFVLTSDSESCPNALLEAMRASLPVVSTNCTNLEDIIQNDVNGYIVDIGNAKALAEKLRVILSDDEKKKRMGTESERIVKENFNLFVLTKKLQDTYINCIKQVSKYHPKVKGKLQGLGLM